MKGIQSNGFLPIIAQAIAEMEELHGEFASINEINGQSRTAGTVREREFPRRQSFLQHHRSKLARTEMVQFTERNLPSCRGRCASAAPHGGMR